jgi:aldehyde dehydrogenase (NAD+)
MDHYKLFIDGKFVDAEKKESFETIDPGTGRPLATVAKAGRADAEAAIMAARRAFDKGDWRGLSPYDRMTKLQHFSDHLMNYAARLIVMECLDAGQVINLAKVMPYLGINLLRNLGRYMANDFPWEEEIPISGNLFSPAREYIRREPIGVCVGIIPWNFPMSMAFWKLAPALIMGNTVVLKPASVTPLSALIIPEAAKVAGIPDGVLNVIAGPGGELGKVLCTHPDVDKIAFTGSTEVGRQIMNMASGTVKKVTLELGGKSANIILDDADMDLAVEGAMFGTFFHQGQICESGTRVLVAAKIYDEFVEKFRKRAEALRVGYQMDFSSHMGPLVSKEQLSTVEGYVRLGKEEGAELVTGGRRVEVPGKDGYYYAPTVFSRVDNNMRIAQEEIFGPVVCLIKFDSDEEAVAIANDSIYGLGGGVFSATTARAERVARGVRTGTVWINNYHVFADYCPFGGYKQSGVGRELGGPGLHEYTLIKRIHVPQFADHRTNATFAIMSDYKRTHGFIYNCPTAVAAGHGSLSSIAKTITDLGCRRALVLTDPGVRKAGLAAIAEGALSGFCVGTYDAIPSDPDLDSIDRAVEAARDLRADCLVSVGGGSVIDTAKAACVALTNGGKINDHVMMQFLTGPQTPHICIPTTAGTGSEVTNVAVLTSKVVGRKMFLVDNHIIPNAAILDPRFTLTLPAGITATTAMDAMTHAIEALTSTMSNHICDGQALHAIRLIGENLPAVIADGRNEEARLNLQIAATMAGWAFTVAQLGLVHGMAHTMGALHHVPHGAACGIILPAVIRFNADHAAAKLALVAQALGVNTAGMEQRDAALAAADALEALMRKVRHPMRLRDMGVPEDALKVSAVHAVSDSANLFNARPVNNSKDILNLYREVY